MKKILLVSMLVYSFFSGFGQDFKPGYIITNNGQREIGQIKFVSNDINFKVCTFKDENGTVTEFSPGKIEAYGLSDQYYYVSKDLAKPVEGSYFLECLVDGIVDLYFLKVGNDEYYFMDKGGKFIYLNNEEVRRIDEYGKTFVRDSELYKGVLRYWFGDAPAVASSVESTGYNHSNLILITKQYHNRTCEDYDCVVYNQSVKPNMVITIFGGYELRSIDVNTTRNLDNLNGDSPSFGILFGFTFPKFHDRLGGGFGFSSSTFKVASDATQSSRNSSFGGFEGTVNEMKFIGYVDYAFSFGNFKPYVGMLLELGKTAVKIQIDEGNDTKPGLGENGSPATLKPRIGLKYDFGKSGSLDIHALFDVTKSTIYQDSNFILVDRGFSVRCGFTFPIVREKK